MVGYLMSFSAEKLSDVLSKLNAVVFGLEIVALRRSRENMPQQGSPILIQSYIIYPNQVCQSSSKPPRNSIIFSGNSHVWDAKLV